MNKGDKVVYVFGDVLICEEIIGKRVRLGEEEIKLPNGSWYPNNTDIFHQVPKDFKVGIYHTESK